MGNSILKSTTKLDENIPSSVHQFNGLLENHLIHVHPEQKHNILAKTKSSNDDEEIVCQRTTRSLKCLSHSNNLSTSRSFINFSKSRSKSQKHKSAPNNNIHRKSSPDLIQLLSKTYWPVPYIESTFLSHFNLATSTFKDKFKIESFLEKGAYGSVYRVKSTENDTEYALKVLQKSRIICTDSVNHVKTEVDILSVCGHHPFIIKLITYWQTHRDICILTEFMSGGEFSKLLSSELKLPLIQLYVAEIALALDFLHNAGIIYRDLKPENILLDHLCHIKLIDFGLSKWLKIGQRTNEICGSLKYMAPEILCMQSYGHAVDWWALGVVASIMVTNRYPTLLRQNEDIMQGINMNNPEDDSNTFRGLSININELQCQVNTTNGYDSIHSDCRDLLNRLLEILPEHRMRSLLALQRIAMYKGYDFNKVKLKMISPMDLDDKLFTKSINIPHESQV